MFLITSAAYVTPALASEFGKLPPCMLPVQNKRLYEHQVGLAPKGEAVVLSLPKSFQISAYDKQHLDALGVRTVYAPDSMSLGESVVYVLNVVGRYDDTLTILHGDTLFARLTAEKDVCSVDSAEDNYDWASADFKSKKVYSGFFSFSDQSLFIQKITESGYDFIAGIDAYSGEKPLSRVGLDGWMDFGLVNTYYRSISKMTTQRVFNSMRVTCHSVRKSSGDKRKMAAEANWLSSLPVAMKHYAPAVWDTGEEGDRGYYEIEYYFLSSLANLFVFGRNKPYVWEDIVDACVDYLNEEFSHKPDNATAIARQNNRLYAIKTAKRLEEYSAQTGVSLDSPWVINGTGVPSLREIVEETDAMIEKDAGSFVSIMHGDPCFSNILYDFKSKSIKVIDPRGVDLDGNLSIYGDFRYDVGKLAHSIIGMYDYIIGGMFDYAENTPYDIRIGFDVSEDLRQVQDYFRKRRFGGYTLGELSAYPILVHLFLSMLPLHCDNRLRQKAMLANALRLYVELKNNQLQ